MVVIYLFTHFLVSGLCKGKRFMFLIFMRQETQFRLSDQNLQQTVATANVFKRK